MCDLEVSRMRRSLPRLGCSAKGKKSWMNIWLGDWSFCGRRVVECMGNVDAKLKKAEHV